MSSVVCLRYKFVPKYVTLKIIEQAIEMKPKQDLLNRQDSQWIVLNANSPSLMKLPISKIMPLREAIAKPGPRFSVA